jgi:hypothetical protein
MKKSFLLVVLLASLTVWYGEVEAALTPVHCHRYSTWLYPWRQMCPLSLRHRNPRAQMAKRAAAVPTPRPPASRETVIGPSPGFARTPFDLVKAAPTPAWVKAASELKL